MDASSEQTPYPTDAGETYDHHDGDDEYYFSVDSAHGGGDDDDDDGKGKGKGKSGKGKSGGKSGKSSKSSKSSKSQDESYLLSSSELLSAAPVSSRIIVWLSAVAVVLPALL
jgi:hypothetical protein